MFPLRRAFARELHFFPRYFLQKRFPSVTKKATLSGTTRGKLNILLFKINWLTLLLLLAVDSGVDDDERGDDEGEDAVVPNVTLSPFSCSGGVLCNLSDVCGGYRGS